MNNDPKIEIKPIGSVSSSLLHPGHAPKQGNEGAPEAWLLFNPEFEAGLTDLQVGDADHRRQAGIGSLQRAMSCIEAVSQVASIVPAMT